MKSYRVFLFATSYAELPVQFDCEAENTQDAEDQALAAYPFGAVYLIWKLPRD